jgi:hypothetical protein
MTLFLVEGSKDMQELIDTGKASILCADKRYIMKRILCSNTFLVRRGDEYTQVKHIFGLVESEPEDVNISP